MQINSISPSFKSAFRYLNNVNQDDIWDDLVAIKGSDINHIEQPRYDIESLKHGIVSEMFIAVDDSYDEKIEALLFSKGIDFHKKSFKETLNPNDIKLRMILTPFDEAQGKTLVDLDIKKLESAFQKSAFYLTQEELTSYEFEHYQNVYNFIKLGSLIDAPSITLKEENNELVADFQDGRHRFCVLRDLNMDKIPVALDKKSIELAKKHGLIK